MKDRTQRIFIALGANLGDRETSIQAARDALSKEGWEETGFSGLYRTPPWGKTDQPPFLNAVAEGRWSGDPYEFLNLAQKIEAQLGRERLEFWGPRLIDIDILTFGETILETERLTLPHPYLAQRAFVLVPWAVIAPNFIVPIFELSVQELLAQIPDEERNQVLPSESLEE